MSEQNAIVTAILESNESLVSAIKIANQVPILQKNLIKKLNEQLNEKISQNSNYQLHQNIPISLDNNTEIHEIEFKGYNLCVCIGFGGQNFNGFYIGYTPLDEDITIDNPIFGRISDKIIQSLPNKNMKSEQPNWLGWYYIENLRYWQYNPDIWVKINDGSLANSIMQEIDELYENIVKNKIKIEP